MRTIAIPLTVLAFLLAATAAEAQNPQATVTVEITETEVEVEPGEDSAGGGGGGAGNDTGNGTYGGGGGNQTGNQSGNETGAEGTSVSFEVTVQAGGFVCTAGGEYEVTLTASGGPNGVTATVEPANLTFEIRTNVYPSASSYSETQSASLVLSAGPTAQNGTGEVTVAATLSEGPCTPRSSAATGDDSLNVTVGAGGGNVTGPGNDTGGFDDNLTGNDTGELNNTGQNVSGNGGDGGGIPGFESVFVTMAVALAVALVAVRRRRQA